MNCDPGIHQKCLDVSKDKAIQRKADGRELVCSLIYDEMSIRKHIQYSHSLKRVSGLATYGVNKNEPEIANQVIVFMVSGLDEYFQLPVAYHFISDLNKFQRRELLTSVIDALHSVGVVIATVTFDGHPSKKSMCNLLGANLDV